ncbi:MAG: hypothetical protein EAZ89_08505 [Bacteroidetes bacterium]|nr:MAG: hypothetical protein EAZ89_08505 [Bacteroidota bacterium]
MEGKVVYQIDSQDIIRSVNADWVAFAQENQAEDLSEGVIGRSIWEFMSYGLVGKLYKELFDAVREARREVRVAFRCDNAQLIRIMELCIWPREEQYLEIHSKTVLEQPRGQPLREEVLSQGMVRGIPMCSKCNKIYAEQTGAWMEISDALTAALIEQPLKVSFGLCERCTDNLTRTIERLKKQL